MEGEYFDEARKGGDDDVIFGRKVVFARQRLGEKLI